jgi:hypothetical protein
MKISGAIDSDWKKREVNSGVGTETIVRQQNAEKRQRQLPAISSGKRPYNLAKGDIE